METEDNYVAAIAPEELAEGKMKLTRLEGTPILFIKLQGEIYVIDNRCPHMGCGFSGGSIEGDFVVCPCHDWRFNLKTGEYEDNPEFELTFYEYKIEGGKIWVNLPF
jgi:3-phenylpropionate/trans-cinnamate dioxygenase ferredoxin subunit